MPTLAAPPLQIAPPTGGVRRDLPPTEVPPEALVDAENWLRWQGAFRTRPGLSRLGTSLGQRPLGLIQYTHRDHASRVVVGTAVGWWQFNSATKDWTNITGTPLTGAATNAVVFRTFSKAGATWLLGVNGKDSPKKWDGLAPTYVDLGGAPPIARCLMVLADRILLGNLSSGGTPSPVAIDVSAFQDFDSGWGTVETALLATTPGEIVAMQEMGYLQGVVYKEDAIELAIAQDAALPFRFEFKQSVSGPVSPAAVAVIADGLHAYLARDGAVRVFDGVQARSLGLPIQRVIAETWSVEASGRAWVAWHPVESALLVVYPGAGALEPDRGVVIRWPSLEVYPLRWAAHALSIGGVLDLPLGLKIGDLTMPIGQIARTLGEFNTLVTRIIVAQTTGQILQEAETDDDGVSIPAFFETGLTDLGAPERWKTLTEIEHYFAPTPTAQPVTIRLGTSVSGEDRTLAVEAGSYGADGYGAGGYGSPNALDLATGGPWVTGHRLTTRRLSLRVEAAVRTPITWLGASPTVVLRGPR